MSLPLAAIGGLRGPNSLTWLVPQILQSSGATLDFGRNFKDMRDAGWIGGDKYFHCKANCQATRRGKYGEATARAISEARELYERMSKATRPVLGKRIKLQIISDAQQQRAHQQGAIWLAARCALEACH